MAVECVYQEAYLRLQLCQVTLTAKQSVNQVRAKTALSLHARIGAFAGHNAPEPARLIQ